MKSFPLQGNVFDHTPTLHVIPVGERYDVLSKQILASPIRSQDKIIFLTLILKEDYRERVETAKNNIKKIVMSSHIMVDEYEIPPSDDIISLASSVIEKLYMDFKKYHNIWIYCSSGPRILVFSLLLIASILYKLHTYTYRIKLLIAPDHDISLLRRYGINTLVFDLSLSSTQKTILKKLYDKPLSLNEIAEITGRSKSYISRLITELEKNKLVTPDPATHNKNRLTDLGKVVSKILML